MAVLSSASAGSLKSAATIKSASTLKGAGQLREAASTVRSAAGSGDGRKIAARPTSAGAGKVAQYNRQKPLREKVRKTRQRRNQTSITDSGVEEG